MIYSQQWWDFRHALQCVSCVVSVRTEQRLHSRCALTIHLHNSGVINHTVQAVGLRPFFVTVQVHLGCRDTHTHTHTHTHSAAGTIPHIWILDCRYYPVKVCMGHKDNKSVCVRKRERHTHTLDVVLPQCTESQSLSRRWVLTGKVWMGEMAITQIDSHRIVVIHEETPAAAAAAAHTHTNTHFALNLKEKLVKQFKKNKKYTHIPAPWSCFVELWQSLL